MEQNTKKKLFKTFAIILIVLTAAYIVATTMPFLTYEQVAENGSKETVEVTLSQYLWETYKHADLTGKVLPSRFTQELGVKYNVTSSVYIPLFAYIGALICFGFLLGCYKKSFCIFLPLVWSVGSLIGYFISPIFKLANTCMFYTHIAIFALTLVASVIAFFMLYLPQMKYNYAHRSKY